VGKPNEARKANSGTRELGTNTQYTVLSEVFATLACAITAQSASRTVSPYLTGIRSQDLYSAVLTKAGSVPIPEPIMMNVRTLEISGTCVSLHAARFGVGQAPTSAPDPQVWLPNHKPKALPYESLGQRPN
jgi:hypothetical protein